MITLLGYPLSVFAKISFKLFNKTKRIRQINFKEKEQKQDNSLRTSHARMRKKYFKVNQLLNTLLEAIL